MIEVAAFGSFKQMMHTGDTSGKVKLSDLPAEAGNWGVGALAGMKGELLLHDGRMLVSRGTDANGQVTVPVVGDAAALFAIARVKQWRSIPVPSDMSAHAFETFLVGQAARYGFDRDAPFVFRVDGRFPELVWHVVTGTNGGTSHHEALREAQGAAATAGHAGEHSAPHTVGHANARAAMKVFRQPGGTGELVGVYSGVRLEAVASHPNERTHIHFVDRALSMSGHVDRYSVARGSVLMIPLR